MAEAELLPFTIEPFDPSKHDRTAFSCGIERVDNYFKTTANKLAEAGNIRLFVMIGSNGALIGFYSINAHSVHYEELPKKFARTRPIHGSIPAAYISMIGRDQRYRGNRYGNHMLVDALSRIARAAEEVGIALVMLDVLDCGNADRVTRRKQLYESFGFQPLPSNPLRMYMSIATVQRLLAELNVQQAAPETSNA